MKKSMKRKRGLPIKGVNGEGKGLGMGRSMKGFRKTSGSKSRKKY
jgi:hypothetical protein